MTLNELKVWWSNREENFYDCNHEREDDDEKEEYK